MLEVAVVVFVVALSEYKASAKDKNHTGAGLLGCHIYGVAVEVQLHTICCGIVKCFALNLLRCSNCTAHHKTQQNLHQ